MGIVNVTPDSFSDGGLYLDPDAAIDHGIALVAEGADLLDIGGESTRPGAAPVNEQREKERVLPVIQALARRVPVPLSVDTCKPSVATAALHAGATIVNDIQAGRDPAMGDLIASSGAGLVAMHMQGTPVSMQVNPHYTDVLVDVKTFLAQRLDALGAQGIHPDQVVLDVGIGFGKSLDHNLELLGGMRAFKELHRPLLVGVSRKSFLGRLGGGPVADRLPGGLAATCLAVAEGVQVVRTHDVSATVQALRVAEAILSKKPA
jgi:dihydropteroate synthase